MSNEKFYKIFKLAVILPITNNTKDLLEEVLEKVSLIFQFGTLNFHVIFL
ncbi:hypothetical protein [Fusobacterium massiliense]|nr:hypothetical protein [Fusobacterium massiliense]